MWQIRAASDGGLYASTEPAALFRSDDCGASWHEIEALAALPEAERWCVPIEPPQPGRARALVIDEADPDRIWVGVEVGGVARSTDRGDPYSVTVASAPTAFSHYKDPGGACAALYRSDDQGQSWRSLCDETHSPSPVNFHGLVPGPDHVGGVLVGTDIGEVWRVSDNAQWTELSSGLPLVWSLAAV
ncbi:WD40/YVTN/BNR-like repeat-containing protein [Candidatus Poriferisodalis sp.]|uniref:WD40/YVTN/BNR-like repeat-containing protein n=1 Tax=Candidatus Poriferisodalis sp. TaxID=3101277 RepID=UPI003B026D69